LGGSIGDADAWFLVLVPAATYLISVEAGARMIARHLQIRERNRLEARRMDQLSGALLTARTFQHRLNNHLSLTVGYCELLTTRGAQGEMAQAWASEALLGARQAAEVVEALQELTYLDEDRSLGETIVDLPATRDSRLRYAGSR
jgi:hypothetical protein